MLHEQTISPLFLQSLKICRSVAGSNRACRHATSWHWLQVHAHVVHPGQLQEASSPCLFCSNTATLCEIAAQAAQLQSLRSSLAASASANLYGTTETQVLLELQLLDAELPLIFSSSLATTAALRQSSDSPLHQQQQHVSLCNSSPIAAKTASSAAQALAAGTGTVDDASAAISAAAAAAAVPQVVLSVLVSAAVNLPMVPR